MKTILSSNRKRMAIAILGVFVAVLAMEALAQQNIIGSRPGPSGAANDPKGPVGSLSGAAANMATVPNVVGKIYKDAIPVIQGAGFYATANESLGKAKNMKVLSQSPAAGTRAAKKTFITCKVK